MRQHAYLKITDKEGKILNSIAENLGFLSRTDLSGWKFLRSGIPAG